MACTELYALLNRIANLLDPTVQGSSRDTYGDWTRERKGCHWFLERTVTYATDPTTFDITFSNAMMVQYIEQIWDDDTAKNFSIRKYTSPGSTVYSDWNTKTLNQDTSDITLFTDGLLISSGSRIKIIHDTLTAGKITTVKIQVDEI